MCRYYSPTRSRRQLLPVVLGWLLTSVCAPVTAAPQSADLDSVKAAYIYNFIKFTEWPEAAFAVSGPQLILCTDAHGSLLREISSLTGKSSQGMILSVRDLPAAGLAGCQIAVIEDTKNRHRLDTDQPVLTIHSQDAPGGMLRLFREGNRLRFSVNLAAAKRASIKLSSRLIGVAAEIIRGTKTH